VEGALVGAVLLLDVLIYRLIKTERDVVCAGGNCHEMSNIALGFV